MSESQKLVNSPVALSPDGTVVMIPQWLIDNLKEAVTEKMTGSLTIHMQDGGFANGELKVMIRKNGNGATNGKK